MIDCRAAAAVALLAVFSPQARSDSGGFADAVMDRARQALERVLHDRYPNIERFDLVPFEPHLVQWQKEAGVLTDIVVPDRIVAGKRAGVLVRYRRADGFQRESTIWWSVGAFRRVLVTRRLIRARELVREADLIVEKRDIAGLSDTVGEFIEIEAKQRARRFIPAGVPLRLSDLDPVPEVGREQPVRVKVHAGSVEVETVGLAAEEGRTGDVIHVTNPGSKKRYSALVTGIGEVSVGGVPN